MEVHFNFVCCICREIPADVVESECCNSLFCWNCVVKSSQCPCGKPLDPETCKENLAVKKIIELIQMPCKYSGCSEKFPVSGRASHEEICPYGLTLCPNSELCGILVRQNLAHHMSVCHYRRTQCHMCEVPLILSELQAHLENDCEEVQVDCPSCSTKILRKGMRAHMETDCPYAEVDCPFAQYGCASKLLRKSVEAHIADNVAYHVRLISTAFESQQDQISQLRDQIMNLRIAAQFYVQPQQGIISSMDQTLSRVVSEFKRGPIWNHPQAIAMRAYHPAVQASLVFFCVAVLLHLVRWFARRSVVVQAVLILSALFVGYQRNPGMYRCPSRQYTYILIGLACLLLI